MVQEFHYRIGRTAQGAFPGHHKSRRGDSGLEFRGHASLLAAPDPRRLDLHASLRDPFGDWIVRLYKQRKAVPVYLLADLSGSMGCGDGAGKLGVLADFAESLGWSAWRTGDPFGFVGCGDSIVEDLLLPATHVRGAGSRVAAALRGFAPGRCGAAALADAHRLTGRQRALVFLASDFHLPPQLLDATLDSLSRHELVPLLLWRRDEFGAAVGDRSFGLVRYADAESGQQRTLLLRPGLRRQWDEQRQRRNAELDATFARHGLRALRLGEHFRAAAVSAYFHGGDG